MFVLQGFSGGFTQQGLSSFQTLNVGRRSASKMAFSQDCFTDTVGTSVPIWLWAGDLSCLLWGFLLDGLSVLVTWQLTFLRVSKPKENGQRGSCRPLHDLVSKVIHGDFLSKVHFLRDAI